MGHLHNQASVLTVTFNNSASIESYFFGLEAQGAAVGEVIVVDNGSVDDTVAKLLLAARRCRFPIRIIKSKNEGFSAGMNRAAAARTLAGLPLLSLNPDVMLSDSVLATMLATLGIATDIGIVTAPLIDEHGDADSASVRSLPELKSAMAYSIAGRFLPSRLRYNAQPYGFDAPDNSKAFQIGATTGALMLLQPSFRASGDVFDPSYWMYGEDLQMCRDAQALGMKVLMAQAAPSLHLKGLSSGRPRRLRSNWAFHEALFIYYRKNLNRNPAFLPLMYGGVLMRFVISAVSSGCVRTSRTLLRRLGRAQSRFSTSHP
ncbi:glycosyltransferase family 2 protein [Cryobacterium sp. HLT2-28]|uniref:glycosyltransferase family 2 protein n=1 Tax=Cryobacterium sp. HLT2-28 TaxID=1259146 RepID=UPI00141B9AF4|nr:glycosyltransferase family 2 protein [Cryobacterium sp. HLT2-28]